jgi:hypothetical protein
MNSLELLESIIQNLVKELESYARKENANQIYINKQNVLIEDLIRVYNCNDLIHFDSWLQVENVMSNVEQQDKEISGHVIQIRTRQAGNNFTKININPFQ